MEYKWNCKEKELYVYQIGSLNPCFNGIQMEQYQDGWWNAQFARLNPCFNGIQMEPEASSQNYEEYLS